MQDYGRTDNHMHADGLPDPSSIISFATTTSLHSYTACVLIESCRGAGDCVSIVHVCMYVTQL